MKIAVSMVLMWVVAAGAVAAEDPVQLLPSPLVLPKRIGPMVLVGEPHKYDDPRLGVSYQYGGDGLSLTVYIYDAGETDLPDGADTMPSCREFEVAKQGVAAELSEGGAQVRVPGENSTHPTCFRRSAKRLYEYEREAQPTISFIWVTTVAKHFVKLRMSMASRLRDEVPDARRAVLSTLGEAIKPHLSAGGSEGRASGYRTECERGRQVRRTIRPQA